jgi:heat shock protein HslJ/uncharacterized membrane protein
MMQYLLPLLVGIFYSSDVENSAPVMQDNDPFIRLYNQGYDFYATGNEPFWNLAIDLDKEMRFSRMGYPELITPPGEENRAMDANVVMYGAETDSATLVVEISQGVCKDTMADEERPFKVRVRYKTANDTEYTEVVGCGNYLADPRLHNIWAMTDLNGKPLSQDDFANGIPRLELFTNEGRVLGFDGCNTFRGYFYVKDGYLNFGPMATTLMACEDIMDIGAEIGKTLNQSRLAYQFDENELVLTRGESEIRLRAID